MKYSRIFYIAEEHLKEDFANNKDSFIKLVNWHKENAVPLLQVDPLYTQIYRQKYNLNSSDFGIWHDQYALQRVVKEDTTIWFSKKDDLVYNNCVKFFNSIIYDCNDIKFIDIDNENIEFFPLHKSDDTMEQNKSGPDYCNDNDHYEDDIIYKCLKDKINEYYSKEDITQISILDASAVKNGQISLKLFKYAEEKNGILTVNSISKELKKIYELAVTKGYHDRIYWTQIKWSALDDHFKTSSFDIILIAGNYQLFLEDDKKIFKYFNNFYRILKPMVLLYLKIIV